MDALQAMRARLSDRLSGAVPRTVVGDQRTPAWTSVLNNLTQMRVRISAIQIPPEDAARRLQRADLLSQIDLAIRDVSANAMRARGQDVPEAPGWWDATKAVIVAVMDPAGVGRAIFGADTSGTAYQYVQEHAGAAWAEIKDFVPRIAGAAAFGLSMGAVAAVAIGLATLFVVVKAGK